MLLMLGSRLHPAIVSPAARDRAYQKCTPLVFTFVPFRLRQRTSRQHPVNYLSRARGGICKASARRAQCDSDRHHRRVLSLAA